ncbi:hypothetical protein P879_02730, partial [Paragonimus westermani]
PPYFEERPPKVISADENGNLRLFCNASGAPSPKLQWWVALESTLKEQTTDPDVTSLPYWHPSPFPVSSTNNSHSIHEHTTKMWRFPYVAKQDLRPIESVLSHYKNDAPEIKMSHNTIQQYLGESTVIGCTVKAHPMGIVEWELNHVPIPSPPCNHIDSRRAKFCQDGLYGVVHNVDITRPEHDENYPDFRSNYKASYRPDQFSNETSQVMNTQLIVTNITHSDLGLYTCRMRTSAGSGEAHTRLEAHQDGTKIDVYGSPQKVRTVTQRDSSTFNFLAQTGRKNVVSGLESTTLVVYFASVTHLVFVYLFD